MDIGKRSGVTVLGLVVLAGLALGSNLRKVGVGDAGITVTMAATTAAATSSKPTPAEVPDPKTDYTSMDDAKLDGNKANGKTLLIRVWRSTTTANTVTLFTCGKGMDNIDAKFGPEKRPLVKSLIISPPFQSECPRVVVKITGKQEYGGGLKGDLQDILDVTPADPETLPAGVDYVSMDDVAFDGKKAAGKVAQLRMYRGDVSDKNFTGFLCKTAGMHSMKVAFKTEQKEVVKGISASISDCQSVKVKLTSQDFMDTWNAQLIELGKD